MVVCGPVAVCWSGRGGAGPDCEALWFAGHACNVADGCLVRKLCQPFKLPPTWPALCTLPCRLRRKLRRRRPRWAPGGHSVAQHACTAQHNAAWGSWVVTACNVCTTVPAGGQRTCHRCVCMRVCTAAHLCCPRIFHSLRAQAEKEAEKERKHREAEVRRRASIV